METGATSAVGLGGVMATAAAEPGRVGTAWPEDGTGEMAMFSIGCGLTAWVSKATGAMLEPVGTVASGVGMLRGPDWQPGLAKMKMNASR